MGRSSRQAASNISMKKMAEKPSGIWNRRTGRRNRKRKAGTKRSNGVSGVRKGERTRGKEKSDPFFFIP